MGITYWPLEDRDQFYELRVDEQSTREEIDAEIEYWIEQLQTYGIPEGPYRSAILKAVQWMNSL